MARRREVDPRFFRHRKLYELERDTAMPCRIAFEGLWVVSDREGRFRWDPDDLKLFILPYDPLDFGAVLTALEGAGFIRRYAVGEKVFGDIPTFLDHQRPHPREAQSRIPPCPDVGNVSLRFALSNQRQTSDRPGNEKSVGPSGPSDPQDLSRPSDPQAFHDGPQVAGDSPTVPLGYLTRCVIAMNAGIEANPGIPNPREVSTSEQQAKVSWEADGVPIDLVERVVREVGSKYTPNSRSRQPSSLKYFDAAIRREWELAQQPKAEDPYAAAARNLEAKYAGR